MPPSRTNPVVLRRVEFAIRLCAPVLDLLLTIGDRVSGALAPDDPDYALPRMAIDAAHAPRGLRAPSTPAGRSGRESELA